MTSAIYYNTFLAISLITAVGILLIKPKGKLVSCPNLFFTILIGLFAALCMGLLPVSIDIYTGTDRNNYALSFIWMQNDPANSTASINDALFSTYTQFLGKYIDYTTFFIVTAIIYIGNYILAAHKLTPKYCYILVLLILTSFCFYGYGVNTIRAGFAISFVALALAYSNCLWKLIIFLLIGIGCHFSMIIPSLGLIIARYFDKTKMYFYLWFAAILASAVAGDYFENLFAAFTEDQRSSYLLSDQLKEFYNSGFRIDFILYSCVPFLLGYYYIYKLKFESTIYKLIYNAYILTNIFFVLVIRAAFVDRFAYLSWFMIPFILVYPLLTKRLVKSQNQKIALIIILQESFTYFMYLK